VGHATGLENHDVLDPSPRLRANHLPLRLVEQLLGKLLELRVGNKPVIPQRPRIQEIAGPFDIKRHRRSGRVLVIDKSEGSCARRNMPGVAVTVPLANAAHPLGQLDVDGPRGGSPTEE